MMNLIWRIILIVLFILFFGYLGNKCGNDIPKIDDDTVEIIMDQQIIDTYYTE